MLVVMALWRLELERLLPSYTPYGVPKSTDPEYPILLRQVILTGSPGLQPGCLRKI